MNKGRKLVLRLVLLADWNWADAGGLGTAAGLFTQSPASDQFSLLDHLKEQITLFDDNPDLHNEIP